MKSGVLNFCCTASLLFALRTAMVGAEELKPVLLPPALTEGGQPLMEALRARRTTRDFRPDKLPSQVLANLLWAAFGINRPQTGQWTAPSSMNSQELDIYAAMPEGLFLYEAKSHQLSPISTEDIRPKAGGQDSFRQAPVTLICVADLPRLAKSKPETRPFYAGFDAGCVCQNVYLFCASEGLATVVHDLDRRSLAAAMKLRSDQQIILAQA